MHIGITGTRDGGTLDALYTLRAVLSALQPTWLHHGDCVGVDSEAHTNCRSMSPKTKIHSHPPVNSLYRAHRDADEESVPKEYLERNQDIVDVSCLLIAIPKTVTEEKRSGTWSTVRYAIRRGIPVMLICPNGDIEWL